MKKNKYVVQYTLPNIYGANEIFTSFASFVVSEKQTPVQIFGSLCFVCIQDVKRSKCIDIQNGDIVFSVISLLDSRDV